MSKEEFKTQVALGTLTPLKLFLRMLSMQTPETINTMDWPDDRNPKIRKKNDGVRVEISGKIVFFFNEKEEYVGSYCYEE